MAQASFLGGRVIKQSLPIIEGRPGPDAPSLKRRRLAQGDLAQIYDAPEGIRYLAALELRAGALRGNHYHHHKEEHIYVIAGALLVVAADIQTGERISVEIQAGDLCVIRPGIAHALRTMAAGEALEFSPGRFDPTDSVPFSVI